MQQKLKNKYFTFPITMIVVTIISSLWTYSKKFKSNKMILEELDITGYTKIFLFTIFSINILILIFCALKGKKAEDRGYDYRYNKIFAIIFIILAITSILSFICIRSEEEKISKELSQQYESFFDSTVNLNNKKEKEKLRKMQEQQQNDKFYQRKMQISSQIDNSSSTFERYLLLFIYWPRYNKSSDNGFVFSPSDEESYYAIYSIFTIIDIICGAFYLKNINDKDFEEKSKIYYS